MPDQKERKKGTSATAAVSTPWLEFFRRVRVLAARLDALEMEASDNEDTSEKQVPGG